ncbi:unnamed protein product [Arctogadus glacialis]
MPGEAENTPRNKNEKLAHSLPNPSQQQKRKVAAGLNGRDGRNNARQQITAPDRCGRRAQSAERQGPAEGFKTPQWGRGVGSRDGKALFSLREIALCVITHFSVSRL